jgi:OmcA/MtrC family decaheme c-type cytochrome
MNRASRIASLILFGLFLAGCEGNDGVDGEPGPQGPEGPQGPPGLPGPSTGGGVPVDSAELINIAVTGIDVPDGGGKPTVSLTLTNDLNQGLFGLPAEDINFVLSQLTPGTAGGSSEWQSYKTREDGGVPDVQASTENGAEGDFKDVGDGTYTYEFASALTDYPAGPEYDGNKVHRIGIEIRGQAPNSSNGIYTFIPATGDPAGEDVDARRIVDNDTCNACHDRLEFHGGPRTDVDYCVTCHNPYSTDGNTDNTVDMKALIHNIHAGRDGYVIFGFGDREHDYSDVRWTQDLRNCQTCHDEDDEEGDTPQASNWRLVQNRASCGTCHYDDGIPDNDMNDYAIEDGVHPGGIVFPDDTQCVGCHGDTSEIADGRVRVAKAHEIPEQIASENFAFNILSVTNTAAGEFPVVQFSVTNPKAGDAPYNIQTDPEFTTCEFRESRLAVSIGWSTEPDYTNAGTGNTPAQPVSMNPLTGPDCGGTSTDNGDGTFTVTSPTAVPAGTTGTLAVTIDGHPAVDVDPEVDGAERIAVTNVVAYAVVTDTEAQPRRNAVAIEKCDDCHNRLSVHGNNRTDEPEVCVVCHNPNATDVNRRVPPCTDDLGSTDDVSIDFKRMIHLIHASGATGVPYDVCGFGFPSTAHSYDVTYPGHLNNCEGCHEPGGYYPVEAGEILGTTVDVGADLASPIDDVVISPNASVCSSCHASDLAKTHMEQNGGDFVATKAADGTLISSGVESCALCHGEGRSADVREVHGVSDFQFN